MSLQTIEARGRHPLPPLGVLQDALRKTTETLARELATPSTQVPRWSDLEWRIAEAAAVMQGISALLANRLRWRGPQRWQDFLSEQKLQTQLRQGRIDQLLARLHAGAAHAGIALIGLKGAALYRLGVYPRQDRPMGDVDLLVRSEDVPAARSVIVSAGYRVGLLTSRHQLLEPDTSAVAFRFGEHPDHPIKIDLHCRIAEHLPVSTADITSLQYPAAAGPGMNDYPSESALMRHLLLHAATNMRARALRYVQLHDIALLAKRLDFAQWHDLLHAPADVRCPWWIFPPLALVNRYFPSSIPAPVLRTAHSAAPRNLRRVAVRYALTDVSWSQLRIQAFPGIEWCRSPLEALRFVSQRIFPSRTDLAALHTVTARRPYGASVPWYGLSHLNRIVRWVFANPPRVQAIYPIRIALGLQQP